MSSELTLPWWSTKVLIASATTPTRFAVSRRLAEKIVADGRFHVLHMPLAARAGALNDRAVDALAHVMDTLASAIARLIPGGTR